MRSNNPIHNSRRGFTIVEVVVSLVLMVMLSGIAIGGMIYHGRLAQANIFQQRIAEEARYFVDMADVTSLDATILRVDTGPSGANTVLTIGKPDPANAGVTLWKQFAYYDADGNAATINDNVILERNENTPMATTGKQAVHNCSPVGIKNIFFETPNGTGKKLVEINLRIGDRQYPSSVADDAISGIGYQSFQINSMLSTL